MRLRRAIPVLLLAGTVMLAGCKKKPATVPPPQSQAPTVTQPEPQLPPTQPTQPPPQVNAPESSEPVNPPVAKPRPAPPKKPVASNAPPPAPTNTKPNKTVVEGSSGADSGQLSAAMPDGAAAQQRTSTTQLLEATETNLKSITRPLNDTENEMVRQIQNNMRQSRLATADGDTERAYNLALKARLLSDELVKRK